MFVKQIFAIQQSVTTQTRRQDTASINVILPRFWKHVTHYLWLGVGLLAACGVVNSVDTQATLQMENADFATEVAALATDVSSTGISVLATAQAAETHVIEMNNVNRQLLATVRAGVPPTVGAFIAGEASGNARFSPMLIGGGVDENGCVSSAISQFSAAASLVYTSAQAFGLPIGTSIGVEVRHEGMFVLRDSWALAEPVNGGCIWTTIDRASAGLEPGRWTVQFFVDNRPLEPVGVFTVAAPAS